MELRTPRSNVRSSRGTVFSVVVAALLVLVAQMSPAAAQQDSARKFTVTVENVSTPGLLDTDRAKGAVPLSPGAYVVFDGDDPAFTPGEMADSGTRLIAEDGFPAPLPFIDETTEIEILKGVANATDVGGFKSPGGPGDNPALFPGESASFTVTATPGQRLQIETMFVQSDDWFLAFGGGGLELFSGDEPMSGDVTDQIELYDAGTEVDEQPGQGPTEPPGAVQKPVQDPMATNVGTDESEPIQLARERFPDFDIPENGEVIRVSIQSSDRDDGAAPQGGVAAGAGGTAGTNGTVVVLLAALAASAVVFGATRSAFRRAQ